MSQVTFKSNANKSENEAMKEQFAKRLSERLRKVRVDKGLMQEELSGLAGLEQSYVGHLERGVYSPTAFTVWKLARALGVSPNDLIGN